jgi:hypothetical protein
VFDRLVAPRRFKLAACEGPQYGPTDCFLDRHGTVLTAAAVGEWTRTLGITIDATPIAPGGPTGRPSCGRPHGIFPRATFFTCGAAGKIGVNDITVQVTSMVGTASPRILLPRGTQIAVTDYGH